MPGEDFSDVASSETNTSAENIFRLESVLTCPQCGFSRTEVMPADACQFFYQCEGCKAMLKPKAGDCCVFCSYGSVKCPPMQAQQGCCR